MFIRDLILGLFCLFFSCSIFAHSLKVAFFYGDPVPLHGFQQFNWVVVQPSSNFNPKLFQSHHFSSFAYVSVGEVTTHDVYYSKIPLQWKIGKNKAWKSDILDQSQVNWPNFFVEHVITPLWQKGYRGFFLDTLDSYQLVSKDSQFQKQQQLGLMQVIKKIKQQYPEAKLILNRGFDLLPETHSLINAVAAESLFYGWDQANHRYIDVAKSDSEYLLAKLNEVKKLGLPIIVIDYVSPADVEKAHFDAQKITDLGFIPWVTNYELTLLNYVRPSISRKILIVTDESKQLELGETFAFQFLSMPLEYLGYIPSFQHISKPLPEGDLKNTYAGIIISFDDEKYPYLKRYYPWLLRQVKNHIPVVFLQNFGFPLQPYYLKPLGLSSVTQIGTSRKLHIVSQDAVMGFEAKVQLFPESFIPLKLLQGRSLLTIKTQEGQIENGVGITQWGGYALNPFVYYSLPNNNNAKWVLNPFIFLKQALHLPTLPVPDVTTENGRRLLFVHIDGDGFNQKAEWIGGKIAAEELYDHILSKYQIPSTVSVIVGEIEPNGMYPKQSKMLMQMAKKIFELPWVELASHTYSHPYNWENKKSEPLAKDVTYNLPIPNYHFNLKQEIDGSVDFINRFLSPHHKTCGVYLWSGQANVNAEQLAMIYRYGILNMNGGDTQITNEFPSITHISPMGIELGKYYQIYAPVMNENIYTNSWTGPFYGYEKVIQTFELTENPRRLKPIDIYYHFYSAAKTASLKALDKVYKWALQQSFIPIYASEYILKVLDFHDTKILSQAEGYKIITNGHLRELRSPRSLGYPDLEKSENIVGYNEKGSDFYIHLGPKTESLIYYSQTEPRLPYLDNANGEVTSFMRKGRDLQVSLKSKIPLEFTFSNIENCQIKMAESIKSMKEEGKKIVYYQEKKTNEINIRCPS